jgi:hypothetical protein
MSSPIATVTGANGGIGYATAYSLHPGVIGTSLAGEAPAPLRPLVNTLLPSVEQGASTSVYVATAPGLERFSGQYFAYRTLLRRHSSAPARMARGAADPGLAAQLWRVSEALCGISTPAARATAAASPEQQPLAPLTR